MSVSAAVGYTPLSTETLDQLRGIFGPDNVLTGDIGKYCRDEGGHVRGAEAAVFATNAEQIAALLKLANAKRFPVTPRGTGTGLAGGACPEYGGVVLCLERMNRILRIDADNLYAEVEPGVLTRTLRDAAAARGLFYPPDPASLDTSSIGGNAATNAGGPACVKYGTTRDYVLGLEAVLPDGEFLQAGVRTRKGVVGYDLTHLLVGSEGTLCVITRLLLKLVPMPPAVATMTAVFQDMHQAMRCVTRILVQGHLPAAIEFLDHACLDLVGGLLPFPLPAGAGALLLLEADGPEAQARADIQAMGAICTEQGALTLLSATNDTQRDELWHMRRQVSVRIHERSAIFVPEDVVVPIGRIAALVDALPRIERTHALRVYAFGHAGDGNIHLNFTAQDAAAAPNVERAVREVLSLVLDLGGTISGEHGIGLAKKRFLPLELSPRSIRLQRDIKELFDPGMILNPGKLF